MPRSLPGSGERLIKQRVWDLPTRLFHWSLVVLGLLFGAVWAYTMRVRRTILG